MKSDNYEVKLPEDSFLFNEFREVAILRANGFGTEGVKKYIKEKNTFNISNANTLKIILSVVIKRSKFLDDYLTAIVFDDSLCDSKIVNLWSIYKSVRIFREFMNEYFAGLLESDKQFLSVEDIDKYLKHKSERTLQHGDWSKEKFETLNRAFMTYLSESGLMKNPETGKLSVPVIHDRLKEHFLRINETSFLKSIGQKL